MKVVEIISEAAKKALPKPKKRPKKTLWFNDSYSWKSDLDHLKNNLYSLYYVEDEEQTLIATDDNCDQCFGVWRPKKKVGVTFFTPRPVYTVIHPRMKRLLKKYNT